MLFSNFIILLLL